MQSLEAACGQTEVRTCALTLFTASLAVYFMSETQSVHFKSMLVPNMLCYCMCMIQYAALYDTVLLLRLYAFGTHLSKKPCPNASGHFNSMQKGSWPWFLMKLYTKNTKTQCINMRYKLTIVFYICFI